MRTQVAIVGAGPAGLLLAQLLAADGIDSVLVETRTQDYVLARIRAGVLEHSTVSLLDELGLADRLRREGLEHRGIYLQWPGHRHHVDFVDLVGRSVWVYGQTDVTLDLVTARRCGGQEWFYDVRDTAVHDVLGDRPWVSFVDAEGTARRIDADVVVGCDGSFGPSRDAVPDTLRRTWMRQYAYAWLGVLADVAPSTDELIYAWHPDGFALHSMRSSEVSRFYLQVDAGEDVDEWSDDRIWTALAERLGAGADGWQLTSGPITERSVLPMRSVVSTPMRAGRLFLAGDAAHIVPPTGAKGLNLAVADVAVLAPALREWLCRGDSRGVDAYSETAAQRVWRCTHFSWWMTSMLHVGPDPFERELQLAQLRWIASSEAGAAGLAENYAGLPLRMPGQERRTP